jgi:hypothetical protein
MTKAINWAGRAIGVVCAAVLASAWAVALWVPSAGLTVTGISIVTALLLIAFAVFAGIAAAHGHGAIVALFFLASFFPVGAFVMPTDHWLKWVGWVDLGLLLAAVLIWTTGRRLVASGAQ